MSNYWIVIHDLQAYREHPNLIGKEKRLRGKIERIKRGRQGNLLLYRRFCYKGNVRCDIIDLRVL